MTDNYNPAAEWNQALESLEAEARRYNEAIELAQQGQQNENGQDPQ